MRYKVALRNETRHRLRTKIKRADIVVGTPYFYDEDTIGYVLQQRDWPSTSPNIGRLSWSSDTLLLLR